MATTARGNRSLQMCQGKELGKVAFHDVEYDGDIENGNESSNDQHGEGLHATNADK